ncbi:MAG: tRNA (adenosine(37)-N6)-threonylcarbamoyltransferase complex transferase subunit TsaD [Candidatus Gracilibacteria bacterium]|nr:tRNA (adenosine(37)-N6)-threonylcarbamoyltransferase complex transferase subunit TsaD [Candidatus Gracilibacteria bacterium]
MYILAFETSCDDTSVAILRDRECIAMSTRTQLEHDVTGGVVPEVAARSHANAIFPCIEDVLTETGLHLEDMDYIACTREPGLLPSLLTGMTVAKTLALSLEKPLIWVNHIEAHMFANFLERETDDIHFPNVTLTVSGGHTEIYLWRSIDEFELIGQTRDDAAGECFDKIAKMMGLGFPGGAKIAKLSEAFDIRASESEKNQAKTLFPRSYLEKDSFDFSFSGMKSAVKRYIDTLGKITESDMEMIAYASEQAITMILSDKIIAAAEKYNISFLCLAGGVSANTRLRDMISRKAQEKGYAFIAPKKNLYSMDNAAMVGIRAYYTIKNT